MQLYMELVPKESLEQSQVETTSKARKTLVGDMEAIKQIQELSDQLETLTLQNQTQSQLIKELQQKNTEYEVKQQQ
jgi:hypothetical protein